MPLGAFVRYMIHLVRPHIVVVVEEGDVSNARRPPILKLLSSTLARRLDGKVVCDCYLISKGQPLSLPSRRSTKCVPILIYKLIKYSLLIKRYAMYKVSPSFTVPSPLKLG